MVRIKFFKFLRLICNLVIFWIFLFNQNFLFSQTQIQQEIFVATKPILENNLTRQKDYNQLIVNSLNNYGKENNQKITLTTETDTNKFIKQNKNLENALFVSIQFEKKAQDKNLNLYAQIYELKEGNLIDAYNLTDEFLEKKGIQIDPQDILEEDDARIDKFSKKLLLTIKLNRKLRPNYDSITRYIKDSKAESFVDSSFLDTGSGEDRSMEVFDLLQNQYTKASTKYSKKANEAPNIVSIVSDKEIQDQGRITLNDIIYNLPGFSPSQTNQQRTISARGIPEGYNNNHLLMLIDGVQFNDVFYGTAYTNEITPINMIKSLEVIRGPGSTLYGSNATNGVISINTYSGEDFNGDFKLRVRAGEYATYILDLMTGNKGELFSYFISYNYFETNGNSNKNYDGSGRTDEFGYLQKFDYADERNSSYLFTKLEGVGALEGLSFQIHRMNYKYQTFNGWVFQASDFEDFQREGKDAIIIKYNKEITSKLGQEYVLKFARNVWDFNVRYYPDSEEYPNGMWEIAKLYVNSAFARAQWSYQVFGQAFLIGGVEGNRIRYNGDKSHYSNVDINLLGTFEPFPDNRFEPLNPTFEWVEGRNIDKFAPYIQFSTGRIWNKLVEVTLGVRYDETRTKFRAIDYPNSEFIGGPLSIDTLDENGEVVSSIPIPNNLVGPPWIPNEWNKFNRTSPRLGIVVFPTDDLSIKFMTGQAFREPSLGELYGVNTFLGGAGDPRILQPEIIRTTEFGIDYFLNRYINLRANAFQTYFENIINFFGSENEIRNVNSLGNRGAEVEVLFSYKKISGFVNYSRFFRYIDKSEDESISLHPREVTQTPASMANFGVILDLEKYLFSTNFRYQGPVTRRNSDLGEVDELTGWVVDMPYSNPYNLVVYRPVRVPEWYNLNLRFMYKFSEVTQLGISVMNALNTRQYLKELEFFPFDYIREQRMYMMDFIARF